MKKFIWGIVVVALLSLGDFLTQPVSASAWHHGVPAVLRNKTFELNTKKDIGTRAYSFTNRGVKTWAAGVATSSSTAHQNYYKSTGHNRFKIKNVTKYTKAEDGINGSEKDLLKIRIVNPTHLYLYDQKVYHHTAPYKYAGKANLKRLSWVPKGAQG
ncbi:MAG: hypothetical protein LKJ60_03610 [Lentilactobacillus buchneri]|jgi:hypothetical protein|nr:hypothetical protein [Lentilactobacillus buchneri]